MVHNLAAASNPSNNLTTPTHPNPRDVLFSHNEETGNELGLHELPESLGWIWMFCNSAALWGW